MATKSATSTRYFVENFDFVIVFSSFLYTLFMVPVCQELFASFAVYHYVKYLSSGWRHKTTFFPPGSRQISSHKTEYAEHPVNYHGSPHPDCHPSHVNTKHITEADTEGNHGKNRHDHRVFYIVAGAEHIRQHKRRRPQEDRHSIMNHDQNVGQARRLLSQSIDL